MIEQGMSEYVPPGHLHNVGSPLSRIRSETIRSSFQIAPDQQSEAKKNQTIWSIPKEALKHDPIEWLESIARQNGYRNLEEALWKIEIPAFRALAISRRIENHRVQKSSAYETLQHAAVLSRIGHHLYEPARPPVISERRLTRIVELTEFFNQSFYELD